MLTQYSVGQPFPGAVPANEGCVMEMGPDGDLNVLIQYPGCTREERQAFKKSFKKYYYYEAQATVPVAMWVFDFPAPLNAVEVNFDGWLQHQIRPESVTSFMETMDGQVKNSLMFYLLDGQILRGIKHFGLEPDAVIRFQRTILKQIDAHYAADEYARTLASLYAAMDLDDIRRSGKMYSCK